MKNKTKLINSVKGRVVLAVLALVLLSNAFFPSLAFAQDTATVSAVLYIRSDDTLACALIAARDDEGHFSLISMPVNTRGIVNIKKDADKTDAVYSTLSMAYEFGGNNTEEKIENVILSLSRIAGGIDIDEVYAFDSESFAATVEKCNGISCSVADIPQGLDFSFGGYSSISSGDTSPNSLWVKKTQMVKGAVSPSSLSVWTNLSKAGPIAVEREKSDKIMLSGSNASAAMESKNADANLAATLISGILIQKSDEPEVLESDLGFIYRSNNASLFDDITKVSAQSINENSLVMSGHTRIYNDGSYFIPNTTVLTDWVMKNIYFENSD